jgi:hypothetical protein
MPAYRYCEDLSTVIRRKLLAAFGWKLREQVRRIVDLNLRVVAVLWP